MREKEEHWFVKSMRTWVFASVLSAVGAVGLIIITIIIGLIAPEFSGGCSPTMRDFGIILGYGAVWFVYITAYLYGVAKLWQRGLDPKAEYRPTFSFVRMLGLEEGEEE